MRDGRPSNAPCRRHRRNAPGESFLHASRRVSARGERAPHAPETAAREAGEEIAPRETPLTISVATPSEPLPSLASESIDAGRLQECVRDLVALSNMPACWIGRSPVAIAESVRDLMIGMLRPDSVYVQLQ